MNKSRFFEPNKIFSASVLRVQSSQKCGSLRVIQGHASTFLSHPWQSFLRDLKYELLCPCAALPTFYCNSLLVSLLVFHLWLPDEFLMAGLQNTMEVNGVYILLAKSALERLTCLQMDPPRILKAITSSRYSDIKVIRQSVDTSSCFSQSDSVQTDYQQWLGMQHSELCLWRISMICG